ncbi:MAG: peptidoglycan bridge formation glycyltransferase FemA/FemB family protein [Ignavibacteria bacterium]|nr:peptidoglycan bridge formation glycyltransferase FemA/FemB family protein [Ignavibacteria bacterium]
MLVERVNIENNKSWNELLTSKYNIFFDYKFLKYNIEFKKDIEFHHLIFKSADQNKVLALLTGSEEISNTGKAFYSCKGASFGGFIWRDKLDVLDYQMVISALKKYLIANDFKTCIINNPPSIYLDEFNEEYEYALQKEGFNLTKYSLTNIINLSDFDYNKLKNPLKRSIRNSSEKIEIKLLSKNEPTTYMKKFYNILLNNRMLKNIRPTHTLEELLYLKNNLEDKVIFFSSEIKKTLTGICVLFLVRKDVILNFYLATDEKYKKYRVADYLLYTTINWAKENNFRLYDIGTSDAKGTLIEGLYKFKKKFRAFGYLRKSYSINF